MRVLLIASMLPLLAACDRVPQEGDVDGPGLSVANPAFADLTLYASAEGDPDASGQTCDGPQESLVEQFTEAQGFTRGPNVKRVDAVRSAARDGRHQLTFLIGDASGVRSVEILFDGRDITVLAPDDLPRVSEGGGRPARGFARYDFRETGTPSSPHIASFDLRFTSELAGEVIVRAEDSLGNRADYTLLVSDLADCAA
jgi:hypothetical protein